MRKLLLSILAVVCVIFAGEAQNKMIHGTVTDASGNPIVGAAVVVTGTGTGVTTNPDGRFAVSAPANGTLDVSFLGYVTQRVAVNNQSNIKISMVEESQTIDDVVVLAYGTQNARTATASVSKIKGDALKDIPSVSVDQMMQGRAAGVQISTPNAGVGQASTVLIRGVSSISASTDPLYVVDGVPITTGEMSWTSTFGNANGLADINPADIISIDVLKDAAATALYGSRAASGVILITTRQGQSGRAKVTYDMNIGISTIAHTIDMMNAQQYTDFKNLSVANLAGTDEVYISKPSDFGNKAFNMMQDSKGRDIYTNWHNEIFKSGMIQNHTVAIQGGSENVQYYMSANYTGQEGIIIGDEYARYGARSNVNAKVNNWLRVGLNLNYSHSKTSSVDGSRNDGQFASSGLPRASLILPPNVPVRNEDGSLHTVSYYVGYGGNTVYPSGYPHPIGVYEDKNYSSVEIDRIIGAGFAEVTPVQGLSLKSQIGVDYAGNLTTRNYGPTYQTVPAYGGRDEIYGTMFTWTWTNTATYDVTIADNHHLNAMIGMEAMRDRYRYLDVAAQGIQQPQFNGDGLGAGYDKWNGAGGFGERTMASYFGRLNYDYKSKYLISGNYRRDGYSPLGDNKRWGNFWGVSAAWRISEEPFFERARDVMNELKIKASYGTVGNSSIGYYPAKTYYSQIIYGGSNGLIVGNYGDSNLGWESSHKYDVGFSAQFLNNISIDVDYFYTRSNDLVMAVTQGPSTGIGSLITNTGKLKNSGVELGVSADIFHRRNFTWTSSFNITFSDNKVLELAEGIENIISGDDNTDTNITLPGYSVGQIYAMPTGGIDPATGRRIFFGSNGERTTYDAITGNYYLDDGTVFTGKFEQVRCGNTLPTWFGGWTNTFRFYGFDITLFMQFSGGNWIANGTKATTSDYRWWNNSVDVLKNAWRNPGDNATYAKPIYGDNVSNGSANLISDFIERGDYLRMKNICIGYTFDTRKWGRKAGISAFRVYAQVQNAFTITGYTGFDPETTTFTSNPILQGGYDKNTMPQARTWTFGLSLTF